MLWNHNWKKVVLMCLAMMGHFTNFYAEEISCLIKRRDYSQNALSEAEAGITLSIRNISSPSMCASLCLQQSASTVAFLFDRTTKSCKGTSVVMEPGNEQNEVKYYVMMCRVAGEYLGCFKDEGARDLGGGQHEINDNTPSKCIGACAADGFSYAGTQYGRQCFCGNTYGKYGLLPESSCNKECAGDPSQFCGGTWCNSVYYTGV